ncbi:hypothetical protein DPSP01_002515 [Paraphaeosphaeria sporulosa]
MSGEQIKITGTATALHEAFGSSIADPGQGIMTSRPYYGRFELDFGLKAGLKMVAADTPLGTCLQPDVVDAFEQTSQKAKAGSIEIRAVLIINPQNRLRRSMLPRRHSHRIHVLPPEAPYPSQQRRHLCFFGVRPH